GFLSPAFILADSVAPTGYLHDIILGFHHQLLRCEVVDIQGDLPAVGGLADLGDAAAELAAQRLTEGRARRGQQGALPGQQAEISRPGAAAGPLVPVLGDVGHPEGLVEEAAAMVPVAEGVPAGAAQEGEGDAALGHGVRGCRGGRPAGPYEEGPGLFLARLLSWLLMEIAAAPGKGRETRPGLGRPHAAAVGGCEGRGLAASGAPPAKKCPSSFHRVRLGLLGSDGWPLEWLPASPACLPGKQSSGCGPVAA
uniref:Uncharacterized protein n=1 Tax=Cyanistes caeruleus TaxID=156563 RepID=A0A8C0Z9M4_CYACU